MLRLLSVLTIIALASGLLYASAAVLSVEGGTIQAFEYPVYIEVPPISATIDIDPDTLNKQSQGKWLTAYIELPDGYDVYEIDINTIKLNGVVPAVNSPEYDAMNNPESRYGDYDNDGILDCMVKFDRQDVQDALGAGDAIEVTVNGKVAWRLFLGIDVLRVINLSE